MTDLFDRADRVAYFGEALDPIYRKMVERLIEKSLQWGNSWRDQPFSDGNLLPRLRRAVDHLESALYAYPDGDDNEEILKRAADVANLAMIAADPLRNREVPPEDDE